MKFSRDKVKDVFKKVWDHRPRVPHGTILVFSSLLIIFVLALSVRLLPLRWGMTLSEFDPFLQYRFTEKIVKEGYFSWLNWNDPQRWYPWGAEVFKRNLSGLPLTAATFYMIISALGVNIALKDFCIIFPAVMGAVTCIAMYFLGKEIGGKTVGLFSALILALSPTYITRTSLGFFDDESVGVLGIILFFLFFLRSIDEKRPAESTLAYGALSGLSLGYICLSWGAAFYPIGLVILFSLVMIILRRYSERLLITYSLTFGICLLIASSFPSPGVKFLTSWPILLAGGVFLLLCLSEIVRRVRTTEWKIIYIAAFLAALIGGFSVLSYLGYMGSIAGKFISVINPFAREGSALIMSVQEHHMTSWSSLYYEFGITIIFMILGFFFAAGNLTNKNIFLILYGLTSLYFASSMVRIIVLASPAVGLLGGLGIVGLIKPFMTLIRKPPRFAPKKRVYAGLIGKEFSAVPIVMCFLILMANFAFPFPRVYSHSSSPTTLLSGSMPIRPNKPVTEWIDALQWMKNNLPQDAVVFSWWDYGYWITVEANRTSVADNNTFNTTQIALIGRIFVENETNALKLLSTLKAPNKGPEFSKPPEYILVFTVIYDYTRDTIRSAYGGWPFSDDQRDYPFVGFGDFGKWTWMLQISAKSGKATEKIEDLCESIGVQREINVGDYVYENNMTRIPRDKGGKFYNSLIYLLMEHARCKVVSDRHPGASISDPTDDNEFFKSHFELIYPTRGDQLNSYGGYVPIIAIYRVHYDTNQ